LLIIDDEIDMLRLLERSLSEELQCDVETATKATEALQMLQRNDHDVVLADIRMPGMDGMEFLAHALGKKPHLTIVMMTAYGSIDLAVQSIKLGAYDFISKPFEHEKLTHLLKKALERSRLVRENLVLQDRIKEHESFHEIVGVSPKMRKLFETLSLVSKTDVTILLTGESGTGKDMVARAIHALSDRRNRPFVAVNCPNLPENILESELFGYRRGAFTNATQDKKGLFLEAQGGTICLDEIGDIPLTLQTKLLSVLQEKEIRPLGQTANIKVDVRIIASTNQDLDRKMTENLFREDLYYRLNVVSLHLPPLRERPEDIAILVEHFLERYCKEFHRPRKTVTPTLMNLFMSNPWRGNVRELENIVSRSVLLSPGDVIRPEDIDWKPDTSRNCLVAKEVETLTYKEAKKRVLESFHREYLTRVLTRHDGNVTRAAKDCGLERQALQQVLRRYGISPKEK
jgi:DNA-binding NtrC family response regulator